jgi:prepilin-type N-terminal cleavage/methylation domain-containing protein
METADMKQRGFTLVELLVVVSIIILLVALAVPMVGRGIQAANRARCSSNLGQLAAGVSMYRSHNQRNPRGYFPPYYGNQQAEVDWVVALTNFVRDAAMLDVLYCPSRRFPTKQLCYSGHPRLLGKVQPYRETDIQRPSSVILFGDAPQGVNGTDCPRLFDGLSSAATVADPSQGNNVVSAPGRDGAGGTVAWRHRAEGQAAAVFAFVDGHTEPILTNSLQVRHVSIGF